MLLALVVAVWVIAALAIAAELAGGGAERGRDAASRAGAARDAAGGPGAAVADDDRAAADDRDVIDAEWIARGAPGLLRRARRPGVVLVHGVCGFGRLGVGRAGVDYFRGVAARLDAAGLEVVTAELPPLAGVPTRALALARLVDALPHDRLIFVAHSMGGLDARWAIARERLDARAAALITIGTPHRGTPIADLLARRPLERARATLARLGLSSEAVDWLTTARLAALNPELPDVDGVRYASVVTATADRARVHPLLRATHAYLARTAGPSDGLVPRSSQPWGTIVAEEELDHWAQVGWSSRARHDAAALILRALALCDALPAGVDARALPPARAA